MLHSDTGQDHAGPHQICLQGSLEARVRVRVAISGRNDITVGSIALDECERLLGSLWNVRQECHSVVFRLITLQSHELETWNNLGCYMGLDDCMSFSYVMVCAVL